MSSNPKYIIILPPPGKEKYCQLNYDPVFSYHWDFSFLCIEITLSGNEAIDLNVLFLVPIKNEKMHCDSHWAGTNGEMHVDTYKSKFGLCCS